MTTSIKCIPGKELFTKLIDMHLEGVPGVYDMLMDDYQFDIKFCEIFKKVVTWKCTQFVWSGGYEAYWNLHEGNTSIKPVKGIFTESEMSTRFKSCGWHGRNMFVTRNMKDDKYVYLLWQSKPHSSPTTLIRNTVYKWYEYGLYLGHDVIHYSEDE